MVELYLSKGSGADICVKTTSLLQHQIDGIRFLYRLFTKKKPGSIMNDPSGCGKKVQIVLFLNAMQHSLDNPILILCSEGDEHKWMNYFHKWTSFGDNVTIEYDDPFIKKKAIIHPMTNLPAFTRRDWSIMVMHDNSAIKKIPKKKKDIGLKAQFKIWTTYLNMKENLETFQQIYNWLYPNEVFDIEKYKSDKCSMSDINKSIALDGFMEDIVLRRNHVLITFNDGEKPPESPAKQQKVKKNKDATGTKIKRSKRKSTDDCNSNYAHETYAPKLPKNSENPIETKLEDKDVTKLEDKDVTKLETTNNELQMDVETFIQEHEPIGSNDFNDTLHDSSTNMQSDFNSKSVDMLEFKELINSIENSVDSQEIKDEILDTECCPLFYESENSENLAKEDEQSIKEISVDNAELQDIDNSSNVKCELMQTDIAVTNIGELDYNQDTVEIDNSLSGNEIKCPKSLDIKFKELEEETNKKFKGSILDSMF